MPDRGKPLKVYFVLGEESGDQLAADLLPSLRKIAAARDRDVIPVGLAGPGLEELGVVSLFDIEDIAVMGVSAVVARLPRIVSRIRQTVSHIVSEKPDVLILIDSPDFTHAVAKRVRKQIPDLPVVDYICPSVWAWRSGRARKMRAYVDHVLAILPFEPGVLEELGGPPATYVGHPLARRIAGLPEHEPVAAKPVLLVLPGSRLSEVKRLLPIFGETLDLLRSRGSDFRAVIPAVPHLKAYIAEQIEDWNFAPEVTDSSGNDELFQTARAALSASGTVSLQLALHRVPMAMAYILDPAAKPFGRFIRSWSVILPNLIADWPLVPEDLNDHVRAERLARTMERLLQDTPERDAQLSGFDTVIEKMKTARPPADIGAEVVFDVADARKT